MRKPTVKDKLVAKLERLGAIPTIKAILEPLLQELDQPIEQQKMNRVVELIAHDNSLAAQWWRWGCGACATSQSHAAF